MRYRMKSRLAEAPSRGFEYDFRNSFWGMTKADVKLSERLYHLSESETHITYKDDVMSLEAIVGFHFVDDSLIEAGYAFREAYQERDLYMLQYNRVKLMLTRIYGEPLIDKDISSPSEKKGCKVEPITEAESLVFIVEWLNSRSIIRLLLVSDKSSTEFGVLHLSRDHNSSYKTVMNYAARQEK